MGLGTVNTESGLIGIQKSRYDELIEAEKALKEVGRLHSQQSSTEKPTLIKYLEVFYAGSSLLRVDLSAMPLDMSQDYAIEKDGLQISVNVYLPDMDKLSGDSTTKTKMERTNIMNFSKMNQTLCSLAISSEPSCKDADGVHTNELQKSNSTAHSEGTTAMPRALMRHEYYEKQNVLRGK